jgi:sulfatase modifying factor 1
MVGPVRASIWPLVLAAALGACEQTPPPRRAQVLVVIDTDAPLSLDVAEPYTPMTAAPLFDRLRIEVLDGAGELACAACVSDFSVDRSMLANGGLSFGVLPKTAALYARARLFRGLRATGGTPIPGATIDRIVTLPSPKEGELITVTIPLLLDTLGVASSIEAPEAPVLGRNGSFRINDAVVPRTCETPGKEGQVCVPGGAYWMSDPLNGVEVSGADAPERIAIVSPFWLDAYELTVGAFRQASANLIAEVTVGDGSAEDCSFTTSPGPNEERPVTCVSWETANAFCEARGDRLPTEAELEFVVGGRRGFPRPWGTDEPSCEDVVLARADPVKRDDVEIGFYECAALGIGTAKPGGARRDVLNVPGGQVFDVLGNVSEWAADDGELLGGACWTFGLVVDPRCVTTKPTTQRVARGAGFDRFLTAASSRTRSIEPLTAKNVTRGFRCARSGR